MSSRPAWQVSSHSASPEGWLWTQVRCCGASAQAHGHQSTPNSRSYPGLSLVETPVHQVAFAGANSEDVVGSSMAAKAMPEHCIVSETPQPRRLSALALLVACRVILPALPAARLWWEQSTSSLCRRPQGSHGLVFPQPWSRESVRLQLETPPLSMEVSLVI